MEKADKIDDLIRQLSVETEANTNNVEALRERFALLSDGSGDVGLPVNRKEAIKLFKGMTGRQKFILLFVWGVVAGLGLIAIMLNKLQII